MPVFEITVTLEDIKPAIVRVLHVPVDIRLEHLHLALQAAFGWEDEHLYSFEAGDQRWREADTGSGGPAVGSICLQDLIDKAGNKDISYTYDFGDCWLHKIKVGDSVTAKNGVLYPRMVKAKGTCPPEDVGGVPGYYGFVEAMTKPTHPEHEAFKDWYGGTFDPGMPPVKSLEADVARLAKWMNSRKVRVRR